MHRSQYSRLEAGLRRSLPRTDDPTMFHGALRRNTEGDIDESLVPQSIRDWYDGTDDEQDTDSEHDSDCEWN